MQREAQYFKDCHIAVPAEDEEALDLVSRFLQPQIEAAGGEVTLYDEQSKDACTHIVVLKTDSHLPFQPSSEQKLVTPLWLYDCVITGRLLPSENDKVYNGAYSAVSGSDYTITTTAYQGFQKIVFGRMIQELGLQCTKSMNPKLTHLVIAGDVLDYSSAKIEAARAHGIPVVNVLWLYDSIRHSSILPPERYTQNPPSEMNPFRGAIAMDCSLDVVGDSDDELDDLPPQTEAVEWTEGSVGKGALLFASAKRDNDTASNNSSLKPGETEDHGEEIRATSGRAQHRLSVVSGSARDSPAPVSLPSSGQARRPSGLGRAATPAQAPFRAPAVSRLKSVSRNSPAQASSGSALPLRAPVGPLADATGRIKAFQASIPAAEQPSEPAALRQAEPDSSTAEQGNREGARQSGGDAPGDDLVAAAQHSTDAAEAAALDQAMPDSCLDMSEQVEAANLDVGRLIDHLVPDASQPPEEPPPAPPESPPPASPSHPDAVDVDGNTNRRQTRPKIPVVSDAPLASQQHEEPVDPEDDPEPKAPPKRQQNNPPGVSWMAEPVRKRRKTAAQQEPEETGDQDDAEEKEGEQEAVPVGTRRSTARTKAPVKRASKPKPPPKAAAKRKGRPKAASPSPAPPEEEQPQEDVSLNRGQGGNSDSAEPNEVAEPCIEKKGQRRSARGQNAEPALKPAQGGVKKPGRGRKGASVEAAVLARKKEKTPVAPKIAPNRTEAAQGKAGKGRANKRTLFSVSGMHSKQRDEVAEQLRSLNQAVNNLHDHKWDSKMTHLLLPKGWVRGAKVLCAMAAGAWLLRDDFLRSSAKSHELQNEEDYEVEGNAKKTVSTDACKHWRLSHHVKGKAAFEGLKVAVYGEFEDTFRPNRAEIVSILQAGSAKMLTVNQASSAGADFVVTKKSRPLTDSKIKQLLASGICIVDPAFVINWLAFPTDNLSKCIFKGSKMGAGLKAAVTERSQLELETPDSTALRMNAGQPAQDATGNGEAESEEEDSQEESQIF